MPVPWASLMQMMNGLGPSMTVSSRNGTRNVVCVWLAANTTVWRATTSAPNRPPQFPGDPGVSALWPSKKPRLT